MRFALVALVTLVTSVRPAAAGSPCGTGQPATLTLADAAADAHAFVFVGRVTSANVPRDMTPKIQTGSFEVDVTSVLRGASAKHVVVPAAAEYCLPKAACLPTVFDLATKGATVLVACLVPAKGPPRVAVVAAAATAVADMRRCLAIDSASDRAAALATAYVEGKELARSCVAATVCDDAKRSEAVAAVVAAIHAPKLAAEAKLDLALVLTQPVSSAQTILGCTTPPHLFQAANGADASNALIARTMLEGLVADGDVHRRRRWANTLWGMMVDWRDQADAGPKALAKLGPLAARASKLLRALGGDDAAHYEAIATVIDAANP